jgi:hypothetical protein
MPIQNAPRGSADEISLGELANRILRFYRQFHRSILLSALVAGIAVAVLVSRFPSYSVAAIVDTPQLTLDEWRGLAPLLSDRNLIDASLSTQGNTAVPARDAFARLFQNPTFWENKVQYRSALRRDDIKDSPNIDLKNASTLGLSITITASDGGSAALKLDAIANHLRETLLWNRLQKYLQALQVDAAHKRAELEIKLIQSQFDIEQNSQRATEMRALLATFPELRSMDASTVVSVEGGGDKYMAPLAQVVALEATISEAKADMRAARRDLEKLDWYDQFLAATASAAKETYLGTALAATLLKQRAAIFGDAAASSAAREVDQELALTINGERLRADLWRFKALPALPSGTIPSRNPLTMGAAAFLVVFLALSLLLLVRGKLRQLDKPGSNA